MGFEKMLLCLFYFINHMSLQFFVPLLDNFFEYAVVECAIKAAAIPPRFAVLIVDGHDRLYFDIESFIVDELVHEHGEREQVTNEW